MFGLCCSTGKCLGESCFSFVGRRQQSIVCCYTSDEFSKLRYSCATSSQLITSICMELLHWIVTFKTVEYVFCSYVCEPNLGKAYKFVIFLGNLFDAYLY